MGTGWRRLSEGWKQGTLVGKVTSSRDFVATSNLRTTTMLKEAGDFLERLKRMEKEVLAAQRAAEQELRAAAEVAVAGLPHVFEETAVGAGGAVKPVETIGGPGFSAAALAKASQDLSRRMEAEVLSPLQRWRVAYETLEANSADVEDLLLEVDSRRRTVGELEAKCGTLRAKAAGGRAGGGETAGGDKRQQAALEAHAAKLAHKQEKLRAVTEAYQQAEGALHKQLTVLIKDAAWLRNFVAAALLIQGQALTDASHAFNIRPASGARASPAASTPGGGEQLEAEPAGAAPAAPGSTGGKAAQGSGGGGIFRRSSGQPLC